MQSDDASRLSLYEAHLNKSVDGVEVILSQPLCQQPSRYTIRRREAKAAHDILISCCQLVQREQCVDMPVVGRLGAASVLVNVDGIDSVEGSLFGLQLC